MTSPLKKQTRREQIGSNLYELSMSTIFDFCVASEKTNKEFGETKQTWQLRDFAYFMELGF